MIDYYLKLSRILLSTLALLVLVSSPMDSAAASPCTVRIGWEEYPPFAMVKAGSHPVGFDLDTARALVEALGCEVHFVELPWTRALRDLEEGRLDLLTAATQTPERDVFAVFTKSYRDEAFHLVRAVGTPDLDLSTAVGRFQRVGIVKDYYYGTLADRLINDPLSAPQFDSTSNDETNLRKLENGRLQYAIIDRISFRWQVLQQGQATNFVLSREPVSLTPLRFMVSRRSPLADRLSALESILSDMQIDGRTSAIVARYAPDPAKNL